MHGSLRDQLVQASLDDMQKCVRERAYQIEETTKNRQTRLEYGYTIEDQENVLLQLTVADYDSYEENENDSNMPPVWIFKTVFEGHRFYVKYYFVGDNHELVIVMSDHLDNEEMKSTWHK